ncbi:MAG: DUF547 domain-containing protein [Nitrospirota bacterium]|nr:DUF547 domain-containing protein [Nitrospirota bacterium]
MSLGACLAGWAVPALAALPDLAPLDRLLHRHVRAGEIHGVALNRVDYAAWGADSDHAAALAALENFDAGKLASHQEQLAFWINAYNLLAIQVVIEHRTQGSIRDAGGLFTPVWKIPAGRVGGREVTLDQIEHRILRPMGDPRIHMAIVCASVSCPDLRPEIYVPEQLEQQLDDQAQTFLANPKKGVVGDGNVRLSRIFDWFEDDFGGRAGVLAFVARYRGGNVRRVDGYFDYDWALNRQ